MRTGSPQRRRLTALLAAAASATALALLVAGTSADAQQAEGASVGAEEGRLEATIKRDAHGIPHITAEDFGGLGFGYGYAFAEDNICTIAESYVTVNAERSRYFGPNGSYQQRGNGFSANNLNSDFFYQRIIDKGVIEDLLDDPAPTGPAPEIREGVRGYVAGYNKWLAETGVENITDPRCAGAPWVRPISEMDAYRRFYQLALLASQTVAIDGIASAAPPAPGEAPVPPSPEEIATGLQAGGIGDLPIGSNAYGLGSEATDNGKGVVLANPHFPWDGPERFYQAHLTIPGEVNVSGGSLFGVPLILIGHTDNMAWSHTVSTAYRFTPFEETLVPGSPTTYLYDGQPREMQADTVTVEGDPATEEDDRTRTLYSTHHGPVMTSLAGLPLPWAQGKVFTMGDVNAANFRYLNHFFHVNQAQSVRELDEVEREYQGIPWVNTIAADSAGEAYYADIGAIPNVSNDQANQCNTPAGQAAYQLLRLPILNGAVSVCEWATDDDAVAPGIFGYENLPKIFRDDYTSNMNDSYWLTNPEEPLTGYARIIGDENTPRALRTRLGLRILIEKLDAGEKFDRQAVQDAVFNNRQYAGELFRDELVALCESAPEGHFMGQSGPVDVSGACPVLASWDLHDDLDSDGAILFRRFATRLLGTNPAPAEPPTGDPLVFAEPFDSADPVNTPSGLNEASPAVQAALADAVNDLNEAGIPLDAPLRGYQFERRGSQEIPIHGGPGGVGLFNAINVGWDGAGYRNVPHGSSFVMVTQFKDTAGGQCGADDRSILTYSQSENPNSPYWKDQTEMFSEKQWVNPAFCADEVAALPEGETIEGCLPAGCGDPADGDGDGVPDDADECPDEFGTLANGCPDPGPQDGDGDGVSDETDLCPDEPGLPENGGCPFAEPSDTDGDGVVDADDECPEEAGTLPNGCPDPGPADPDGDGVTGDGDLCPAEPGLPENGGCPTSQTGGPPPQGGGPPATTPKKPKAGKRKKCKGKNANRKKAKGKRKGCKPKQRKKKKTPR